MSEPATFGSWLRRLRQTQGLTQEALAEQVGCATQTIRKIESGMRRPSHQMAWRLADMLRVTGEDRNTWMQTARMIEQPEPQAPPGKSQQLPLPRGLPNYFTAFLGRAQEQDDLTKLFEMPGCRLITLVGPGGIGKTRLAIETARRYAGFRDGVVFVSLAPVTAVSAVVPAISEALGIVLGGSGELPAQLFNYLSEKRMLLILDNLEHLLDRDDGLHDLLGQLLAQAPEITILATSREHLKLAGEWVLEIEGLSLPMSEVDASPAVELFLDHARHIRPDIQPGAADRRITLEICRMLGGMPLAIELAAAWVMTLSYAEIAAEIRHGLDFLSFSARDLPPRHHSMRVVFDQSWQRLNDAERTLLARIALFRGGFTRDAATFVARMKLPQLAGLVQKALVHRSDTLRYNIHEVIRRFAEEKFAELPEQETTRQRFIDYYLALSSEAAYSFAHYGDRRGLDSLIPEIDNLRLAMHAAIRTGRGEQGARISTALRVFWVLQSLYREGIEWAEQLLEVPGLSDAARGDLLTSISYLARAMGRIDRAHTTAEEAIAAHRRSGDQEGLGWALGNLAQLLVALGNYPAALTLHRECVQIRRTVSGPHTVAWGYIMLVVTELLLHDRASAAEHYDETIRIVRSIADRFSEGGAHNYYSLGLTLLGDPAGAPIAAQALDLLSTPDYPWGAIIALEVLGAQAGMRGRYREAALLIGGARQLRQEHQIQGTAIYRGDYDRLFELARGLFGETDWNRTLAEGAVLTREELLALGQSLG